MSWGLQHLRGTRKPSINVTTPKILCFLRFLCISRFCLYFWPLNSRLTALRHCLSLTDLLTPQGEIQSVLLQHLLVASGFDDTSALEDVDSLGLHYCGESMRHP